MLQKAIDKVNELIAIDMGSLVENKSDRPRERVCVHQALKSFVITDIWYLCHF